MPRCKFGLGMRTIRQSPCRRSFLPTKWGGGSPPGRDGGAAAGGVPRAPSLTLGPIDPPLRAGPLPHAVGKKRRPQVLALDGRGGSPLSGETEWVIGGRGKNTDPGRHPSAQRALSRHETSAPSALWAINPLPGDRRIRFFSSRGLPAKRRLRAVELTEKGLAGVGFEEWGRLSSVD